MADNEKTKFEEGEKDKKEKKAKKGKGKSIIGGLSLYVIQLIAVYFITANLLMSKYADKNTKINLANKVELVEEVAKKNPEKKSPANEKHFLYPLNDIVVNPAGSNGSSLLMVSIAFDVGSSEQVNEMKSKDVMVKDHIISVLSSKHLQQLSDPSYRDSLKKQIGFDIKELMPNIKLKNVYFSKYIID